MKRELQNILLQHIGRGKAIKADHLADKLYSNERVVREVIGELIDDGLPVCSVTERPAGFFVALNREEAERYTESLLSRAIRILYRRKKVIRNAGLYVPAGQRRLL